MRCSSPVSLISSTSTKEAVSGASVGGRVLHTRGVTLSAPNSTVWSMGISRCEMRPVTLSRAANTAVSFLIFSACAGPDGSQEATVEASNSSASREPAAWTTGIITCCMTPHTC